MRTGLMLLALALLPAHAAAAEPCPTWRERQTMACMRGYLRADPAAVAVTFGDGAGYAPGLAAGMFRSFGDLGLAVGGRFGYVLHRSKSRWSEDVSHFVHVGPELRLGAARERVFVYVLVRGGYSRWSDELRVRTSIAAPSVRHGGHYSLGAGAWGRIGRRFLLGGEVVLDLLHFRGEEAPLPTLTISLTLGAWL